MTNMTITIEGFAPLLEVFDMPRSLRFYRDVLGFQLIAQSGPGDDFGWGHLRLGDVELMLNTAYDDNDQRPPEPDPARVRTHGDTGLYFGCRDLDAAYAHLRACGVQAEPPKVAPYGMKQVWLKDPDGYTVCLQWRAG